MNAEAFEAWLQQPVTKWFMGAMLSVADRNEQIAKDEAWRAATLGQAHEIDLDAINALGVRANAYRAMATATFEQIEGWDDE